MYCFSGVVIVVGSGGYGSGGDGGGGSIGGVNFCRAFGFRLFSQEL